MTYTDLSQALFQFWSQFTWEGKPIKAWRQGHVPLDANGNFAVDFPFITFTVRMPEYSRQAILTAFVWCKQAEGMNVNAQRAAILDQIGAAIPAHVGRLYSMANGGVMWLTRNVEFQSDYSPDDKTTEIEGEPVIGGRISYILNAY